MQFAFPNVIVPSMVYSEFLVKSKIQIFISEYSNIGGQYAHLCCSFIILFTFKKRLNYE